MKYPEIKIVRESIWRRDLSGTGVGYFIRRFLVFPFLIAIGVVFMIGSASLTALPLLLNPIFYCGLAMVFFGILVFASEVLHPQTTIGARVRTRLGMISAIGFFGSMVIFMLCALVVLAINLMQPKEANQPVQATAINAEPDL